MDHDRLCREKLPRMCLKRFLFKHEPLGCQRTLALVPNDYRLLVSIYPAADAETACNVGRVRRRRQRSSGYTTHQPSARMLLVSMMGVFA
jgi:hypothetical protein